MTRVYGYTEEVAFMTFIGSLLLPNQIINNSHHFFLNSWTNAPIIEHQNINWNVKLCQFKTAIFDLSFHFLFRHEQKSQNIWNDLATSPITILHQITWASIFMAATKWAINLKSKWEWKWYEWIAACDFIHSKIVPQIQFDKCFAVLERVSMRWAFALSLMRSLHNLISHKFSHSIYYGAIAESWSEWATRERQRHSNMPNTEQT